MRVVIVTMDTHLASATERARSALRRELPQLELSVHAAAEWGTSAGALERCLEDIRRGDIIVATMLFLEDHFQPIVAALAARRDACDALVCMLSAAEIVRLTKLGRFQMGGSQGGPMALLKRLRGNKGSAQNAGAQQMRMLRRIPKILRFIPGTAQDVRAYFLTLQYWLGGSEDNIANLVRLLVSRYASGPRAALCARVHAEAPVEYPELGVYHPRMRPSLSEDAAKLPRAKSGSTGTVGLLLLRSYLLAKNAGHFDGVIDALEARGLRVIPAFATGLDSRPAIDGFFFKDGAPCVDAVVSLTGFSLVGGPAYNDARAAQQALARLDVPYIAAHPVEFQTLEQWGQSRHGLSPVENTIMVAIPELDGAVGSIVFGGRSDGAGSACTGCERACVFPTTDRLRDMHSCPERAEMLAARVERLVALRQRPLAQRRVALVLFNFPPNAGNTGTAAYLSVFASLYRTLGAMRAAGYDVELPDTVEDLRERIIQGNASRFGADANVAHRLPVDDHVRREPWLAEIEKQWGPAPGKQQSDGSSIFVLGVQLGKVFVGVQPAFGYEGDPMRLLFENGFAPTHAFSAFYRYLREDFGADVLLHFGTHGAMEFMPGKQAGMSGSCWPDRLIRDLPHLYLYASNNPSEGSLAKRRTAATLISYLTPPIARAGLYRDLLDLKASVERWRATDSTPLDRNALAELIQAQAAVVDLAVAEPLWEEHERAHTIDQLIEKILELEYTLIPHGLHVVGEALKPGERVELLSAIAESDPNTPIERATIEAIVAGAPLDELVHSATDANRDELKIRPVLESLVSTNRTLAADHELPAILRALDGRFIPPAPGGDVLRNPEVLPTGRNLHGFDPFRIPSAFALADGMRQAERLLARHSADGNALPESVALVLWGSDNLKTEGAPIGQALALLGARPRFDGYGRLTGATLIPLAELGRPRIDVIVTLSGIFRDLMPLQIKLLAEASFIAAAADEPLDENFVRKHALCYQQEHGCDLETAALRVYGNAEGAYGANVNHLVENGRWDDADQLAENYTRRKSFAYGRSGRPSQQTALLQSVLADVSLTYQNLDSIELGITTVDNYFDTLGGITRAVRRARGGETPPVYIGDQTSGGKGNPGVVRTLSEQVSLETRTRMLNPKWYEGMLEHGYEGVRQIEVHLTNTLGWSATTGQVQPWVYQKLTQTFLLDPVMRERLARLNPTASVKVANRLIEAQQRRYWKPDGAMLDALQRAGEELEDRLEGVYPDSPSDVRIAA
jgi:magnesium chelatase subunit H